MKKGIIKKDWYIMGAKDWISGKPTIAKIIEENSNDGTIMVVERWDDYKEKAINIFVLGASGNYGEVEETKSFVQDTGMGYGKQGKCKIQNRIKINEHKIISSANEIGINEKRPLWVFK